MKRSVEYKPLLAATLAGFVLAGATCGALAQTAENPQKFDTGKGSWTIWGGWGMQGWPLDWDPTVDADEDPNSGSLRYEVPFTGAAGEQIMTFGTLGNRWAWDGGVVVNTVGAFKNLVLDLRVDPSTAPTVSGNYGPLELGFTTDGWGQVNLTNWTVPLSLTNWTRVVVPIDPAKPNLDKVNGFFVKMWSNGTYTNTLVMNIDNVWLQPATNEPPPPPPTLSVVKATPGLNLVAAGTGQYDRQNIRTISTDYSWIGRGSSPVTYSLTVSDFPGPANPGYEVHSYLIPLPYDPSVGVGTIGTGSAPDWGQPTAIFTDLQNQADGSATWVFRFKTNAPDSNGTFYSAPLAVLQDPAGPKGTWTLSFVNDNSATMTSPSGLSTNFTISADILAWFKDIGGSALPMYYYIGAKPQQVANIGQVAVVSNAKVTGVTAPIDDNFLTELDANVWELAQNNTGGVQVLPADAQYWVSWTLPDLGFTLQTSASLAPADWKPFTGTVNTIGSTRRALITSTGAPSANAGFFRLIKRPFTRLQILLPGETAAPGTPTGKTGSPTPQQAGVPFNVIVNAVDDVWQRVTVAPNDEIAITSTDASALLPDNNTLLSGTRTFSVTMYTEGTYTVTATDITDPTKTASTSTAVQVTP